MSALRDERLDTLNEERTHVMLINLLVWIIVGIVGALIGGFLLSLLLPGTFGITGFNLGSLVVAFIGAVILLFIVKLFTGRRVLS